MDRERWERVEQVYHDVLAADPEARAALLDECSRNDPELHEEVQSLLDAREDAGNFLSAEDRREMVKLAAIPAPTAAGTQLGDYQILDVIGSGGMGVVYRARDTRLDREVALKILRADFAHDAERVARFRREAKAASTLSHPNIVTIYEIGQAGGTWFIAGELIAGVTVRERLGKAGKLPLGEAIDVAIQCATALEAAHGAGVVHRDIKPENIMIRRDGVVKLVDFGLARISEAARAGSGSEQLSITTSIMGTPRYMSPEQARGQKLDGRTDIFSLGAVLYEMAFGKPVTEGVTTAEIFASLLGAGAPAAGWPETRLGVILRKALERDREARYQKMSEFADELKVTLARNDAAATAPSAKSPIVRRHPRLTFAASLLLVATLLSLPLYRWASTRNGGPEPALRLVPLTAFAGPKDFAAFSPDGSRIAFSWNGNNPNSTDRHIYVKDAGSGDPVQLTSAQEDDTRPVWSPDGRAIAFVRRVSRLERAIYVVPANGGIERKISASGDGVGWSADGKWLAITRVPSANGFAGLELLSLENGARRALTVPHNSLDIGPALSPDGRWVAFLRRTPTPDVYVIPATGETSQTPRRLTFDSNEKLGKLAWTADSREVVYSTQREYGGEGLWRVPLEGGPARRLSSTLLFAGNPSISRKGDRLAYTESWLDTNIYLSEGSGFDRTGVPGKFSDPVKVVASSREDHSPNFSSDGERIAFVSNRTGRSEIWTASRDGSRQTQLTHMESFSGTPRWSPDGKWIAFDCIVAGGADLYVIASGGGEPRRLTSGGQPNTKPAWSVDGQWIFFNSDRSGSPQIWKISAKGGAAVQVTRMGGREPLPSPDGKAIFYTKRVGESPVWSVPAEGGLEQPVHGLEAFDRVGRQWGVVREGIYLVTPLSPAHPPTLQFFSFATGIVTALEEFPPTANLTGPSVAISADGRYLLTVHTDQAINDLMMIENFR